ncbi:MAG: hypothetical protein HYW49_11655 [Deltaproteobacteria bacterium]|nr:hypothetical protein [Deltaproteobacteria bacterium]
MRASRYDLICCGGSLASYLTAALAAKTGLSVLLLDWYAQPESDSAPSRALLDAIPSLFSFESSDNVLRCFEKLGVSFDRSGLQKAESVLQVLLKDQRFVISDSFEMTLSELEREVPCGEELRSFLSKIYGARKSLPRFTHDITRLVRLGSSEAWRVRSFWGRKYRVLTARKCVPFSSLFADGDKSIAHRLACAMLGALTHSVPVNIGAEQCLRSLPIFLGGRYWLRSGSEALKADLARVIRVHGGDIKKGISADSLVADRDRLLGVLLTSHDGIVTADHVVVGCAHKRLYSTLPPPMRDSAVMRGLTRIQPSLWRFSISVGVRKQAIPVGSTSLMVRIADFEAPLSEDNLISIQIVPELRSGAGASESGLRESDVTRILLTALVPYRASSLDYRYLRRLAGRMLRALFEVMPFSDEHVVSLTPDFLKDEDAIRKYYSFRGLDWMPEELIHYYVQGHRGAQDFWSIAVKSGIPNLYFVGRPIWPSLGTYGEILSAMEVYEDLRERFFQTGARGTFTEEAGSVV